MKNQLILFAPILLFTSISSCLNAQFFVPVGRRAECTRYIIVGALVNFVLNIMLIPKFQSCGAVVASVIAEAIISYLFWKNSDDIIDFKSLFNVSWKKASSGILVVDIVLGTVVYVFSLLFLFKDEWSTNIALSFVVTIKDKLKK